MRVPTRAGARGGCCWVMEMVAERHYVVGCMRGVGEILSKRRSNVYVLGYTAAQQSERLGRI